MLEKCVCCSGKQSADCCGLLLTQEKNAKTPSSLMRSRYSAYALGGYGDYLLLQDEIAYRNGRML